MIVHFHASGIPLQGVEYVKQAQKLLGYEAGIKWQIFDGKPWLPFEELVAKMKEADICLGIFGTTRKSSMVIPNKVYEALAVGKAIITAGTSAIKELLTDRENVLLCKAGDAQDLASKILELKNNLSLREKIAKNGHELFTNKLQPKQIVSELIAKLSV